MEDETNLPWYVPVFFEFLSGSGDGFELIHSQSVALSLVIYCTYLGNDGSELTCGHGTEQSQVARVGTELMIWN